MTEALLDVDVVGTDVVEGRVGVGKTELMDLVRRKM